jgi:ring-1,2-phenylacetyl-CoA epoxidase subunit PaaD
VTAYEAVYETVATVLDPELPIVTIAELGILRDVRIDADGDVEVDITPTYSGCPAMDTIRADIESVLRSAGYSGVRVNTVLAPAWSTDQISEAGKAKLRESGIVPPGPGPVTVPLSLKCPHCASLRTRELSRFGSTACKALWVCDECGEPFDHMKAL